MSQTPPISPPQEMEFERENIIDIHKATIFTGSASAIVEFSGIVATSGHFGKQFTITYIFPESRV